MLLIILAFCTIACTEAQVTCYSCYYAPSGTIYSLSYTGGYFSYGTTAVGYCSTVSCSGRCVSMEDSSGGYAYMCSSLTSCTPANYQSLYAGSELVKSVSCCSNSLCNSLPPSSTSLSCYSCIKTSIATSYYMKSGYKYTDYYYSYNYGIVGSQTTSCQTTTCPSVYDTCFGYPYQYGSTEAYYYGCATHTECSRLRSNNQKAKCCTSSNCNMLSSVATQKTSRLAVLVVSFIIKSAL